MTLAFARSPSRLLWLDVVRGLAILAMASYHFSWDLEHFGYLQTGTVGSGLFRLYARAIASTFLMLAGFGLVLGHTPAIRWRPFAIRLAKIVAAALVITIATSVLFPDSYIFFGILHAIAAASLIGLLFLRLPIAVTLIVALAVFLAPDYLRGPAFDHPALLWLGLPQTLPRSNDYVPLLPWLAPFLVGIVLAKLYLRFGQRSTEPAADRSAAAPARALAWAGRHSLPIYLIHQPLLYGIVYAVSLVSPPDLGPAYLSSCVASCSQTSDGAFCQSFCGCTLDQMRAQSLFEPFNRGQVTMEDPRIGALANQCTSKALEQPPQ